MVHAMPWIAARSRRCGSGSGVSLCATVVQHQRFRGDFSAISQAFARLIGEASQVNVAGISLMHGWLTVASQVASAVLLLAGIRFRVRPIVMGAAAGVSVSLLAYWLLLQRQLMPGSAPVTFWIWLSLAVFAVIMAVTGWWRAPWWRRATNIAALGTICLCVALAANQWAGFYPTAGRAWDALTAQPLANQAALGSLTTLRGTTESDGKLVVIDSRDDLSHFHHRREYVYLPPAWFRGPTPPALPAVVMIGGVVTTPEDWIRSGEAIDHVQQYANAHHGYGPILVFVDPTGSLTNDTECVDGSHGNVDTHITEEIRPEVISAFNASSDAARWAVAGWSMGGTCAIDLTVEHPEQFHTFVDISGDIGPNLGNRSQTTDSLYRGRPDQWARFDPTIAMRTHGPYTDVSGWFESEGHRTCHSRCGSSQIAAATTLSAMAQKYNILTTNHFRPGRHSWQFAATAFDHALPWLMARLTDRRAAGTAVSR